MSTQYRTHVTYRENVTYSSGPSGTRTHYNETGVGYNAHIIYGGVNDPSDRNLYNAHIGYEEPLTLYGGTATSTGIIVDDASNQFSQITGTATAALVGSIVPVFGRLVLGGTGTITFQGSVPTSVGSPVSFAGLGTISFTGTVIPPSTGLPATLDYRIVICDLNNTPIEEVSFASLSLGYALNDAGTVTFSLPLNDPKATRAILEPGQRIVNVFRNGQKVWGGYLTGASPSLSNGTVDFRGDGWFSRLKRRIIDSDLIFEDVDQLKIAWDIIDYAQTRTGGDYGIKRLSAATSGVSRTRRYHNYDRINVGDELQTLSALHSGFDFDITPDRFWRTFSPRRGSATNNYLFELGNNISDFSQDLSADDIVSEVTALGGGQGGNRCLAVVADASTLSSYGLLQEALDVSKLKHYPDLVDAAKEELRIHKNLRQQPQVTVQTSDAPFSGAWDIGDEVRVKADYGYINIDRNLRIVSMNVEVSEAGLETVDLVLDEPFVESA